MNEWIRCAYPLLRAPTLLLSFWPATCDHLFFFSEFLGSALQAIFATRVRVILPNRTCASPMKCRSGYWLGGDVLSETRQRHSSFAQPFGECTVVKRQRDVRAIGLSNFGELIVEERKHWLLRPVLQLWLYYIDTIECPGTCHKNKRCKRKMVGVIRVRVQVREACPHFLLPDRPSRFQQTPTSTLDAGTNGTYEGSGHTSIALWKEPGAWMHFAEGCDITSSPRTHA